MEFRMLGPFEAQHGDGPVDLGDLQQRYALVVLLLHANRPVSPDRLIDILWGENRPRTNLVTGYIAKIRRAFRLAGADDQMIETTPTGYLLRVADDQVDTVRFTRLCDEAAVARRAGDVALSKRLLHEAVGLWRGRFLEDLDIDRIGGSEVITLDEALFDALGDLAELELAAGNHRWVRDRLRSAVHSDPSRQRLAILLMRALLANDDQVEAIKVYHRTREALDEYGMQTSTDLRRLVRLAQYGEPRSTLPPRPARFTGRTGELAAIESIVDGRGGVVWLSGMPGVGKTAVAVEAAHRLRGQFGDAALFVQLNGFTPNVEPTTPAEALARLLLDLGVPPERIPATLAARLALYQDTLAGTRTLVVLDNAASAEQVRPLLPEHPECLAIVTSRTAGDPDAGDNVRLGPLPAGAAAELFRRLAGAERVRGRSAQVEAVVARCGYVPLQIRVVASQFRQHDRWPLEHLLDLLSQAAPWSAPTGFDDAGVVACMVSYQQLDPEQRTLFRLFGQLPGEDLSVLGAAALAGRDEPTARRLLDALHRVSLLEETVPERYHMLDPLKEFATATLRPVTPTEPGDALTLLLDFYLATVAGAITTAFPFDRYQPPTVDRHSPVAPVFNTAKAALEWLSTERPNLVAAIRYAADHDLPDHAWRLAVLLWRYFNTTAEFQNWIETLELAKRIVLADPANRYGQAHVLLRLSIAHRRSGRLSHGLELAAQALPRWVQLGDIRGEADTLSAIALPKMELGDHDQAIAHFEAALTKYEQINDQRGQANALSMLGLLNELHGNLDLAHRQHLASVAMLRAVGHPQGLAHALDNLGSVEQRLGLVDEAITNHEEALTLGTELGDRTVEAYALNYIGNAHRVARRLDEAVRYQERAQLVGEGIADGHLQTQLHLDRGATSHARGDQRAALAAYRTALESADRTGDRNQLAHAHRGLAETLHATGDHAGAAEHWEAAETQFRQLRQPEADEIHHERARLTCACASKPDAS